MTDVPIRLGEVWAFCNARLDEDDKAARATSDSEVDEQLGWAEDMVGEATAHIERHLPTRVLADIAFKRTILEEHEPGLQVAVRGDEMTPMVVCKVDGDTCDFAQGLAAVYATHPDYKEDWRP